jgi:ABC-type antimicrobial peptide transport system permease subunit
LHHDLCLDLDAIDRISLRLAPDADLRGVVAAVRNRLAGVDRIRSGTEVTALHHSDVGRDFVLFDVLLGLILALAALGLVNAMTIAALGRTKEFGVLAALGVGRDGMVAILMVEAAVVCVLAGVVSLVLALPTSWVVVRGLRLVSGLEVPFEPPWNWYAAVPIIAFLVAILASILPAQRVARIAPAEAVRYE